MRSSRGLRFGPDAIAAIGGGVRTNILPGDGFGTSLVKSADYARILCSFTHDSKVWRHEHYSHGGRFREQRGRVATACHEGRAQTPCLMPHDAASPD